MFCSQCGVELPSNAKFCIACGNRIQEHTNENTLQNNDNEGVDLSIVGTLHYNYYSLVRNIANSYAEEFVSQYGSLDVFVKKANNDVANIFQRMNQFFLEFLSQNGIYSYSDKQITSLTKKYISKWPEVYEASCNICQSVKDKLNKNKMVRQMNTAGRTKLVGVGLEYQVL